MKHLEQNIFDLENEFFIWFFNYNYLVDHYGIFFGLQVHDWEAAFEVGYY